MLNQISETMEELKKSGFTNAGHLNKEYGKGSLIRGWSRA